MAKKLGWCARTIALESPYTEGFEVKSCQRDHEVPCCGEGCPDWPFSPTPPKG